MKKIIFIAVMLLGFLGFSQTHSLNIEYDEGEIFVLKNLEKDIEEIRVECKYARKEQEFFKI